MKTVSLNDLLQRELCNMAPSRACCSAMARWLLERLKRRLRKTRRKLLSAFAREGGSGRPKIEAPRRCCLKTAMRMLLLARGYLTFGRAGLRLEIRTVHEEERRVLEEFIENFRISFSESARGNERIHYTRNHESVSRLLNLIGAVETQLALENQAVSRALVNDINRVVNCEIANLKRSSSYSSRITGLLREAESRGVFERLPQRLRRIARLRMQHPSLNLEELASRVRPPLSKSGLYYNLKKIETLVKERMNDEEGISENGG